MIIGNGLIASLFKDTDREDVIFFASGVSNSLETRKEEFLHEKNLIRETFINNPKKKFVYFSTCSIYDSSKTQSAYVLHKLEMEQIISKNCAKHLILRVSNAIGNGGNPNLLMNYLMRAIKNDEIINVHTQASRNLIDTEDIKNITLYLLDNKINNRIINLAYIHNYSIIEILEIIEKFLNTNIKLNLIKSGSRYTINISEAEHYFKENNLTDKEAYLNRILHKYYH